MKLISFLCDVVQNMVYKETKNMKTIDIEDFAQYIGISMLMKGLSVSPLKLQKILYYQQAWHMVEFGRNNTLFDCAPQAWVNGPVYPDIYHIYKDTVPGMCDHLRLEHFIKGDEIAEDKARSLVLNMQLSKDEVELSDKVMMLYGSRTQNQLILMTHSEKPWSEKREGLSPFDYSDKEISLDTMYRYYKERYDRNRAK